MPRAFDMNKLLRGQEQDEAKDEQQQQSIGGKSDGGEGGDKEHGLNATGMNELLRDARYGRGA